jgi:hypothetical protein
MGRQRLPQRDAPEFLARLEQSGAQGIRRAPARLDGTVEVTWEDSAEEVQRYREDLEAWKLVYVVSGASLVLVVLAILLVSLFGGG